MINYHNLYEKKIKSFLSNKNLKAGIVFENYSKILIIIIKRLFSIAIFIKRGHGRYLFVALAIV